MFRRRHIIAPAFTAALVSLMTSLMVSPAHAADACSRFGTSTPCVYTGEGSAELNVRDQAGFSGNIIGSLPNHAPVKIYCVVRPGDTMDGMWGSTDVWDQVTPVYEGWHLVSDGFIYTGSNDPTAPPCAGP